MARAIHRIATLFGMLLAAGPAMTAEIQDPYAMQRQAMLDDIAAITRETRHETGRATLSERVMAAMNKVPRHRFVPPGAERQAYDNRPLPIGHGQTISQPFIVALMTDLLDLKAGDKVLEIGTGCGYQAAVLSELAREVYTIEIVAPLGEKARALRIPRMARAGAVRCDHGDRRRAGSAAGAGAAVEARRQARDSGRPAMERPGTARDREGCSRQDQHAQGARGAIRSAHSRQTIKISRSIRHAVK